MLYLFLFGPLRCGWYLPGVPVSQCILQLSGLPFGSVARYDIQRSLYVVDTLAPWLMRTCSLFVSKMPAVLQVNHRNLSVYTHTHTRIHTHTCSTLIVRFFAIARIFRCACWIFACQLDKLVYVGGRIDKFVRSITRTTGANN